MILLVVLMTLAPVKTYPAKYVYCYDGDTCTFDIYLGMGVYARRDIRVCDIDTPEMSGETKVDALLSKAAAERLLKTSTKIRLEVQEKKSCVVNCEKKSFTRILARVYAGGVDMGKFLLNNGFAKVARKRCQ